MLTRQVPEFDISMMEKNNDNEQKEVILDLSDAEFISEDTLKYFQRLKLKYNIPIKFKNYSLYIEMQLEEFNLLD